jgi:hypothetical protein
LSLKVLIWKRKGTPFSPPWLSMVLCWCSEPTNSTTHIWLKRIQGRMP